MPIEIGQYAFFKNNNSPARLVIAHCRSLHTKELLSCCTVWQRNEVDIRYTEQLSKYKIKEWRKAYIINLIDDYEKYLDHPISWCCERELVLATNKIKAVFPDGNEKQVYIRKPKLELGEIILIDGKEYKAEELSEDNETMWI